MNDSMTLVTLMTLNVLIRAKENGVIAVITVIRKNFEWKGVKRKRRVISVASIANVATAICRNVLGTP